MTRHLADRHRPAGKGRLLRFMAALRDGGEGAHPAVLGAMRRARPARGPRRLVEFLRIARSRGD